jgi:DNA-binding LacI/PurR family transcriptional regulator
MARVTLQTIADQLGISRMTVSNAFSRPDQLSTELRDKILTVADELGYAGPDPAARALARGTTGAVGVLLTDALHFAFSDDVATSFLGAFVAGLAPTGLALTLLTTDGRDDVVPARDVAIDGALVYSCLPRSDAREWLVRRKLPLVYVDQDPVKGITCINVDDRGGARAAAQHLVDLGHRRIGIATLTVEHEPGLVDDPLAEQGHPQKQRMAGWLDVLEPAGIHPTVVRARGVSAKGVDEVAELLLGADEPPTAVLCFSDVLALELAKAAAARGLAVPGDLSVVGFDDSPVGRLGDLRVTTVRQDVETKGRLAAEALTEAIEHHRAGTAYRTRHETLPTELVVRDSTAPPPAD